MTGLPGTSSAVAPCQLQICFFISRWVLFFTTGIQIRREVFLTASMEENHIDHLDHSHHFHDHSFLLNVHFSSIIAIICFFASRPKILTFIQSRLKNPVVLDDVDLYNWPFMCRKMFLLLIIGFLMANIMPRPGEAKLHLKLAPKIIIRVGFVHISGSYCRSSWTLVEKTRIIRKGWNHVLQWRVA